MKRSFVLWLLVLLFASCAKPGDSDPKVGSISPKLEYRGGLFVVWASFPDPVDTVDDIRWKLGNAQIAERHTSMTPGGVVGDTVFLHWERLPTPRIELDTVRGDSGKVTRVDSVYIYEDTIAVVVNDEESDPLVIRLFNILPRIDSLRVAGVVQPGDSNLVLAAHPGERVSVEAMFSDLFNQDPHLLVEWPEIGLFESRLQTDSLQQWSWQAPNAPLDTVVKLRISDTGGYGTRDYNLRLVVYTEPGAVWVASGSDLVKFSGLGAEVARVSGAFGEISDITLNSNSDRLWLLDQQKSQIWQFDAYGNELMRDSITLRMPLSIAVDVESGFLWVSDLPTSIGDTLVCRIRRFSMNGDSLLAVGGEFSVPGPVRGLSIDQFERDLIWFTSPESDFIGYIRDGQDSIRMFQGAPFNFNRPSMVSYDPVSGLAWIADSSRVVVVDTSGSIRATITGFRSVSSVSAAGGVCWVADQLDGSVYRFRGSVTGSANATSGQKTTGFMAPVSVSAFGSDGGVWVADRSRGEVVRLDAAGAILATGTGLSLPSLVRVHQVLE